MKDGTAKAGTVKAGTVRDGTVKDGTAKAGNVRRGQDWMALKAADHFWCAPQLMVCTTSRGVDHLGVHYGRWCGPLWVYATAGGFVHASALQGDIGARVRAGASSGAGKFFWYKWASSGNSNRTLDLLSQLACVMVRKSYVKR